MGKGGNGKLVVLGGSEAWGSLYLKESGRESRKEYGR